MLNYNDCGGKKMYETITTNIMVENVKETIEFYQSILEFEVLVRVPETSEMLDFAIIKKDNISLMFQSKESLIKEYPSLEGKDMKPMFTLFITVSDVETLYNKLKEQVPIAKELHQTFYGKLEFAIFDNQQHILTISS